MKDRTPLPGWMIAVMGRVPAETSGEAPLPGGLIGMNEASDVDEPFFTEAEREEGKQQ